MCEPKLRTPGICWISLRRLGDDAALLGLARAGPRDEVHQEVAFLEVREQLLAELGRHDDARPTISAAIAT